MIFNGINIEVGDKLRTLKHEVEGADLAEGAVVEVVAVVETGNIGHIRAYSEDCSRFIKGIGGWSFGERGLANMELVK